MSMGDTIAKQQFVFPSKEIYSYCNKMTVDFDCSSLRNICGLLIHLLDIFALALHIAFTWIFYMNKLFSRLPCWSNDDNTPDSSIDSDSNPWELRSYLQPKQTTSKAHLKCSPFCLDFVDLLPETSHYVFESWTLDEKACYNLITKMCCIWKTPIDSIVVLILGTLLFFKKQKRGSILWLGPRRSSIRICQLP